MSEIAILNKENSDLLDAVSEACSNKKYFSSKEKISGAYLIDNDIYYKYLIFSFSL